MEVVLTQTVIVFLIHSKLQLRYNKWRKSNRNDDQQSRHS